MAEITLANGFVGKCDDEDYEQVSKHKWYPVFTENKRKVYALTNVKRRGKWESMTMHKMVMGDFPGKHIHHVDEDGLNNMKENLEVVSPSEHMLTHLRRVDNRSGFTGVDYYKQLKLYRAQITFEYKNYFLGYFPTAIMAAKVRDIAAFILRGPTARFNLGLPKMQDLKGFELPTPADRRKYL